MDTILVVVDRLTKYAHFISLGHPFIALTVAAQFIKGGGQITWVSHFYCFRSRQSFHEHIFWRELFRLLQTQLLFNIANHPQTGGQSKIVNKVVKTYLHCFTCGKPKKWVKWINWDEFSYNTSPHLSTKMSPFQALYGQVPPHIMQMGHQYTTVYSLEHKLQEGCPVR